MKKRIIITSICLVSIFLINVAIYLFNLYDTNLVSPNDIKTDENFKNITYNKADDSEEFEEGILGILIIDKIGLKAKVKEGSNNNILEEYIGHIENTSIFDGNIGLAGHNRGYKNSYFARINELEEGDILTYKTKFYTKQYKVDNIKVILDTDWSLLQDTENNKITMITCIANKKRQRLCVQATEIL
ncbi:MAG: class D sortase [Clostridia bacterium]|nr:class D sortase [Clostridia bacterium]